MSNEFITGDTRTKLIQLTLNGKQFDIPDTSKVMAQIISKDKKNVLSSEPLECLPTQSGADWRKSLISLKFPRASTADIKNTGEALVEIQVTINPTIDPEDITYYIPIVLVRGNLP